MPAGCNYEQYFVLYKTTLSGKNLEAFNAATVEQKQKIVDDYLLKNADPLAGQP